MGDVVIRLGIWNDTDTDPLDGRRENEMYAVTHKGGKATQLAADFFPLTVGQRCTALHTYLRTYCNTVRRQVHFRSGADERRA